MTLSQLFKAAVGELDRRRIRYAVAGGFAAGLYRKEPRLTQDVDFALVTEGPAEVLARNVLKSIGLTPTTVRQAELAGGPLFAIRRKSTPPMIVVGRPVGGNDGAGVDLLLPSLPWAEGAVERAQFNKIDFGFGAVPTLTVEDLILAKLHALGSSPLRAKDLDDLQSIFSTEPTLDLAYLEGRMRALRLSIPRSAKSFLPEYIWKMCL